MSLNAGKTRSRFMRCVIKLIDFYRGRSIALRRGVRGKDRQQPGDGFLTKESDEAQQLPVLMALVAFAFLVVEQPFNDHYNDTSSKAVDQGGRFVSSRFSSSWLGGRLLDIHIVRLHNDDCSLPFGLMIVDVVCFSHLWRPIKPLNRKSYQILISFFSCYLQVK